MKKIKNLSRMIAILLVLTLCLPFIFACAETEDNTTATGAADVNDNETPADSDNAAENAENAENNGDNAETPAEDITDPPTEEATDPPPPEEPEEDLPDSGTAKLLGTDITTKGDWIGSYGSEGYIIYTDDDSAESMPAYAKVDFFNEFGDFPTVWTWWDSESGDPAAEDDEELNASREAGALFKNADKTSRVAACWYDGAYFNVTLSVGDAPKKVTLYMNDYDAGSRTAEVTVCNINGKAMKENPAEAILIDEESYVAGCYVSYVISGDVMFEFEFFGGSNVVLSGIFFDPAP